MDQILHFLVIFILATRGIVWTLENRLYLLAGKEGFFILLQGGREFLLGVALHEAVYVVQANIDNHRGHDSTVQDGLALECVRDIIPEACFREVHESLSYQKLYQNEESSYHPLLVVACSLIQSSILMLSKTLFLILMQKVFRWKRARR